jgi:hypothetical protein
MDRAGRRPILLSGALAMAFALTLTGWWIYIDQAMTPNAVVVCVVVYNAAFGMSLIEENSPPPQVILNLATAKLTIEA